MNELLSNLDFIRPGWLVMAPVAVVVWLLWRRHSDPLSGWRRQMAPELLDALAAGDRATNRQRAVLAGWLLAVAAIAGPTWRPEPDPFAADAQPLIILLKADQSMDQTPPTPSRIERAHLKIADLAAARKGQPLGLIAYAGSAHLVLPPTRDTKVVADMAAQITPAIMPEPGDRLDLAIRQAVELLQQDNGQGTLLVVADSVEITRQQASTSDERLPPIKFLALTDEGSPENIALRQAAREVGGSVQQLAVDDADVDAIVGFAERRSVSAVEGEGGRWQEAGYWLTPVIALLLVLSFRRQVNVAPQELT
ncbi:hypothetical protein KOR34_07590 [Posidoniimonas corsicana]|uniref:VWFA domain-containing protein n=1 Tax=Posidoniimonas corsicana TaxID=1938618 RepID=A0A5C5VD03_9BACT|nr:VWA domain-containing protein [Posidoniimonas corsicana]TWT35863.1 hypothetical protein KOR34_07590 [Posidoniimonas corsicana]